MSPDSVGAGSVPGQDIEKWSAPTRTVPSAPVPPPDSVVATGAAVGDTVPSGLRLRVRSTGTQEPSAFLTRTGTADSSTVTVPSGLANTREVSLRREATSTRLWNCAAAWDADASSGSSDGGVGAAVAVHGNASSVAPASATTAAVTRVGLVRRRMTAPQLP